MANGTHGPHSNPVWSTFIFVLCMLLFLFYLETMIRPMDLLVTKSFVMRSSSSPWHAENQITAGFARYGDPTDRTGTNIDNVLLFLHIQKTAGKVYNAHIALDLHPDSGPGCSCPEASSTTDRGLLSPGSCVCDFENDGQSTWLFSRLTVGWPCGVHAGWTDFTTECLDKELNRRENRTTSRRYHMFTMLRDPVQRYLSEWSQVTTHGQWPTKKLYCHPLNDKNYFHGNWSGVKFDDFIHCPDNPANNRQVWMLADVRSVGCNVAKYIRNTGIDEPIENNTLLLSAKRNLQELPFFGILELPAETDALFEHTFGLKFTNNLTVNPFHNPLKLTAEQSEIIKDRNRLDIAFYKFAKELFLERFNNITHKRRQTSM